MADGLSRRTNRRFDSASSHPTPLPPALFLNNLKKEKKKEKKGKKRKKKAGYPPNVVVLARTVNEKLKFAYEYRCSSYCRIDLFFLDNVLLGIVPL